MNTSECAICRGAEGDPELDRVEVWRDAHWRLSMSRQAATLGFAYLEPIRHIPYLADLDGPEAATFGPVIARASAALREASGATEIISREHPDLSQDKVAAVTQRTRELMAR